MRNKNFKSRAGGDLFLDSYKYMDVSKNSGTPKSSIIIGFSIINHPFIPTLEDASHLGYLVKKTMVIVRPLRIGLWDRFQMGEIYGL